MLLATTLTPEAAAAALPLESVDLLIAGADVITAVKYQIMVMLMLVGSTSLGSVLVVLFAALHSLRQSLLLLLNIPMTLAGGLIAFTLSIDDFVITYFVAGVGSTTLPIYVFSQLRFGATPVINTIGTLFVSITMLGMVLVYFVQKMGKSNT